jgi:dUTPase
MQVEICNNNLSFGPKGEISIPCHGGDAGYDLTASSHPKIVGDLYQGYLFKSIKYIEYDTNISISPSQDKYNDYEFFSLLFPRSSISQHNLSLCNSIGVIDSGYRDTIKVRFNYMAQPENYIVINNKNLLFSVDKSKVYSRGDKIAQLIFTKHFHPKIKMVSSLKGSDRGADGFGSTGK